MNRKTSYYDAFARKWSDLASWAPSAKNVGSFPRVRTAVWRKRNPLAGWNADSIPDLTV